MERRSVTITWHDGGTGASVVCETFQGGERTGAWVHPEAEVDDALVLLARRSWALAFPLLFP